MRQFPENGFWASSEQNGRLLILISAVAFSMAGLFTRLAPVSLCAMLFWRGLFGSVPLILLLGRERRRASGPRFGLREAAIVALSSTGTLFYLAAFKFTSVAHIAIIYATAPLLSAGLARLFIGEPVSRRTTIAAAVALCGVVVTVGQAPDGHGLGDLMAVAMTTVLATVAVLARRSRLRPLATSVSSMLVTSGGALLVALVTGGDLAIGWRDAAWLAVFGLVTMSVALPCYLAGAVRVAPGAAMLLSAAELPLAPLWVWMAFGEAPSVRTLAGGAVVALAVVADISGHSVKRPAERPGVEIAA